MLSENGTVRNTYSPQRKTANASVMSGDSDLAKAAVRLGVPLWGRLALGGIATLVLLGAGALWTEHDKFSATDVQLTKNTRFNRVLADKTPNQELIQRLLASVAAEAGADVDKKLAPIEKRLQGLDASLKSTGLLQEDLKNRLNRQEALVKVQDPARVLAIIRAGIQGYSSTNPQLTPASVLQDYKSAVRALPLSASNYWDTVAAIVNYQSLVNQVNGDAPDPTKRARPCALTQGGGATSNVFRGQFVMSNCVVDLGINAFDGVIVCAALSCVIGAEILGFRT